MGLVCHVTTQSLLSLAHIMCRWCGDKTVIVQGSLYKRLLGRPILTYFMFCMLVCAPRLRKGNE
jgi:hypothetical protein